MSRSITNTASTISRCEALVQRVAATGAIHHAVVGVETGDGNFRWSYAVGEAYEDGTPIRIDSPIWIASVTKLYIATSALKLVERGLLNLDTPISAYLPPALIGGLHRMDGVDYTEEITVRHLLGHLSGLPDYLDGRPKEGMALIDQIIENDVTVSLPDMLEMVRRDLTPHFPPQTPDAPDSRVVYSDTNFQLLMAIIEAVTGKHFHEVLADLILAPLGLERTWHPAALPESVIPRHTLGRQEAVEHPIGDALVWRSVQLRR